VDPVGHGSDQGLEEAGGGKLGGAAIEAGEDELRGAVHGEVQDERVRCGITSLSAM
jgi:hypothetical protein